MRRSTFPIILAAVGLLAPLTACGPRHEVMAGPVPVGLVTTADTKWASMASPLAAAKRAATARSDTACQISPLPVPADTWRSDVVAGDPTGKYLVGEAAVGTEAGSRIVPLLWIDGRLIDFNTPFESAAYVDVNASKMILGRGEYAGQSFAWLYRDGRFTRLPGLTATDATRPVALNGRGDAVGHSDENTGSVYDDRTMVLWPAHRPGTVVEMALSGPTQVVDVDDDGTIIGMAPGIVSTSYRWLAGGPARVLESPSGSTNTGVIAIRNGWIGGWENDTVPVSAFAHNVRTREANQITGLGAPYSGNGRGDLGMFSAIVHRDGQISHLPGLGTQTGQAARALSDNGLAAGFASDGDRVHAVTWRGC